MRREWTRQEETYMERRYLLQPVEKTAEKLNRTIYSVKRKAAKMGLNHYTNSLNAKTLAKCFSCDVSVVIRWIEKFDLPCKKVKCSNQTRYLIEVKNFWEWAAQNRDVINWSRYERKSLCPEPDWIDRAIESYNTPKSRKKFTQNDIIVVKNMLHNGLSYREIAEKIGRSRYSVNHLCRNIYAR